MRFIIKQFTCHFYMYLPTIRRQLRKDGYGNCLFSLIIVYQLMINQAQIRYRRYIYKNVQYIGTERPIVIQTSARFSATSERSAMTLPLSRHISTQHAAHTVSWPTHFDASPS